MNPILTQKLRAHERASAAEVIRPDVGGSPLLRRCKQSVTTETQEYRATVGLLALQGDFGLHRQMIEALGHSAVEVRTLSDLERVDCLIMPGGESTTIRKLMKQEGLFAALPQFARTKPIMGTCAGLILLGKAIKGSPGEDTLGLIDCDTSRNAYGSQYQSFRDVGEIRAGNGAVPLEMVFIRAPRIVRVGDNVEVLGRLNGEPTLVRQGTILAMTFHPELSGDARVHQLFLSLVVADPN
ncbi:MAG: pyridoxal 5'-phosphate synthase glutaminase subunit PdxT [candidate division Zixibacteria bacterium]|nr:pyridoxal 5'-phosphate synthase glutaminase subunit PdxT [candidate division Zixibacteria bacterium]